MKKYLLLAILCLACVSNYEQKNRSTTKNKTMENKVSTIRLIYPQWQGGMVDHWMPDIPAEDASRGYYLGAR